MHQIFFIPNYIFNNDTYFLDFRAQKISFDLFECKSLLTSTSPLLWVLNYEKQHKEGTCKVSGRSVVFSAFYADFCLCLKSVIITTLNDIPLSYCTAIIYKFTCALGENSDLYSLKRHSPPPPPPPGSKGTKAYSGSQ